METDMTKNNILSSIFYNDPQINFEVTDTVLLLANFLGAHPPILRSVYKTYRSLDSHLEYKPKIGASLSVDFNYPQHTVVFRRNEHRLELTESQFLIFLGKIDAVYTAILPVGSVVELDMAMMPAVIKESLKGSELTELVTITGRRVALQAPFDHYVVDYYAYLWPIGQLAHIRPIMVSNMMIQRVVHLGLSGPLDKEFSLDVLRATQLAKGQVSTAFMPFEEGLAYYDRYKDWVMTAGKEDTHGLSR